MASTRKGVLFIVEGPSDEAALGGIFTKIFSNAAVKFDVIHGDEPRRVKTLPRFGSTCATRY